MDRHVQQQRALARSTPLQFREPLGLTERMLHQLGAHEGGHQANCLQLELKLAVPARDAGERPLDHCERLQRILAARAARPHQRDRRLRALHLIDRGVGRLDHMVERLGTAEAVLGTREVK